MAGAASKDDPFRAALVDRHIAELNVQKLGIY
jgi:hypothetical protein